MKKPSTRTPLILTHPTEGASTAEVAHDIAAAIIAAINAERISKGLLPLAKGEASGGVAKVDVIEQGRPAGEHEQTPADPVPRKRPR